MACGGQSLIGPAAGAGVPNGRRETRVEGAGIIRSGPAASSRVPHRRGIVGIVVARTVRASPTAGAGVPNGRSVIVAILLAADRVVVAIACYIGVCGLLRCRPQRRRGVWRAA